MNSSKKTVVLFVLLAALCACTNYRVENKLLTVKGVSEITDFLAYEGTISATVLLENGGLIWLHNIREKQFVGTDQIYVVQLGDVFIDCEYPGQLGSTSSGHNIIALVSQLASGADSAPTITTIGQLVDNYDDVVALINSLPIREESGAKIGFPNRQPEDWVCFKIPQE